MVFRLVSALVLLVLVVPATKAQRVGFECSDHSVDIERYPQASGVPQQPPDTPPLTEGDFTASGLPIHFAVHFTPRPHYSDGHLRIFVRFGAPAQWQELTDTGRSPDAYGDSRWYTNSDLRTLLKAEPEPPHEGDPEIEPGEDPNVSRRWSRPQISIQQAESGLPLFLFKFIALANAGGHGMVESETALVIDLRGEQLKSPASVACIKNDFAGQGPSESISCNWDHSRQDFLCITDASPYSARWRFLLVAARKLPTPVPRR